MELNKTTFFLQLDFNKIQNIRFAQSIAESGIQISIKKDDEIKFQEIKKYFNFQYNLFNESDNVLNFENISHQKPLTSFGKVQRPLVYSLSVVDYCKSIWKIKRNRKFSFIGLVTEQRKKALEEFIISNTNTKDIKLNLQPSILKKIFNRLINKPNIIELVFDNIYLWSSDKGRKFPYKSWDDDYYQVLSDSEFVICPNGDFIWTYRFFESIMCGAIPIIEDTCDIYKDFKYLSMKDDLSNIEWSEEDAVYNLKLLKERLTISPDEYLKELKISDSTQTKKF